MTRMRGRRHADESLRTFQLENSDVRSLGFSGHWSSTEVAGGL